MSLLLFNGTRPEISPLDLDEFILATAERGELERHAFIVSTHRKLRDLERELTDEHFRRTGRPLTHLPLYTLSSFIREIYDTLAPGRRDASMEIQIALMERAMKNVDLNYYARPGRNPSLGVVEEVTRVISGVRADGVLPSIFQQDIQAAEENPELPYDVVKLRDLYNIYSEYLRLLGDVWIDYPGRLFRVTTALFENPTATFRNAFPRVESLLIHGYTEFTAPEIDVLNRLGVVEGLDVLIEFDYADDNGPLYGNFEDVIGRLMMSGYGRIDLDPLREDVPEELRSPFDHHVRRNLFRTDERIENSSFDGMISVYGFHTREEEARGIAGLIKSLVLDRRIAPERICVATLDMTPYTDLFRELLPGYGIPGTITSRYRLETNGLITALFSALNIVSESYDRRDVLRAVTSPYLSFGVSVDPAALADASTKLRITRGYGSWVRRIGRRIEFLVGRLASLTDADERRSVALELETLRAADRSIRGVHALLEGFSTRMTPAQFRDAFLTLIARTCATENVLTLRRNLDARPRTPADWLRVHDEMERDTRALARFMTLIDELTELFELDTSAPTAQDAIALLESLEEEDEGENAVDAAPNGTRPLRYYMEHLRTAAARSYYGIREKHDYGVLVTTLDEINGLDFDVTIICGLVDGEFPSTYVPANFLGKPLERTQERHLRRERVLFYEGLTSFTERIYLTYPRFRGEVELVRSSFIDALLRITTVEAGGNVVLFDELRVERERMRREPPPAGDREFPMMITTMEELAEEAGTTLRSGGTLPRVDVDDDARDMLENLRHTAAVEIGRKTAGDEERHDLVPEYRGIIGDVLSGEERAELAERRESEYSASQLELYAKCPFKYFARRLLNVETPARYDVTLTPLERGFLLHRVLFRLYTELREQNALPITPPTRDAALERAKEIAAEEITGISLDHPYWTIDQERLVGSPLLRGLLEQWIDSEVVRTEERSDLTPEYFEVGFGTSGAAGLEVDQELSRPAEMELYDVKVRGRVDRVEILRKGDQIFYTVADYKTGQPPTRGEIEQGLSLQLMIYLEVIRNLLAAHFGLPLENVIPVGGVYYRLNARDVETEEKFILVPNELKNEIIETRKSRNDPDTVADLEERIRQAFEYADRYVEGISSGRFHVTTHDVNRVCRGCEYHTVCRVWDVGRPEGAE